MIPQYEHSNEKKKTRNNGETFFIFNNAHTGEL